MKRYFKEIFFKTAKRKKYRLSDFFKDLEVTRGFKRW